MTTTAAIISGTIAYHIGSRYLGFLLWALIHKEKYPRDGYRNYYYDGDYPLIPVDRHLLWCPALGELVFLFWICLIGWRTAVKTLEHLDNLNGLEDKLLNTIKNRQIKKEFGSNYMTELAKADPDGMRKALEEIGRLRL
jgi:hypothetical protein